MSVIKYSRQSEEVLHGIFIAWNQNEPIDNPTMEIAICVKTHCIFQPLRSVFVVFFKNFISHSVRTFSCKGGKTCTKLYIYVNLLLGTQCNVISVNVLAQWILKLGIYENVYVMLLLQQLCHAYCLSMAMYRHPQVRTKENPPSMVHDKPKHMQSASIISYTTSTML